MGFAIEDDPNLKKALNRARKNVSGSDAEAETDTTQESPKGELTDRELTVTQELAEKFVLYEGKENCPLSTILNRDVKIEFQGVCMADQEFFSSSELEEEMVEVPLDLKGDLSGKENYLMSKEFTARVADLMIMGDGNVDFDPEEHLDCIVEAVGQMEDNFLNKLNTETRIAQASSPNLIQRKQFAERLANSVVLSFTVKILGLPDYTIHKLVDRQTINQMADKLLPADQPETSAEVESDLTKVATKTKEKIDGDVQAVEKGLGATEKLKVVQAAQGAKEKIDTIQAEAESDSAESLKTTTEKPKIHETVFTGAISQEINSWQDLWSYLDGIEGVYIGYGDEKEFISSNVLKKKLKPVESGELDIYKTDLPEVIQNVINMRLDYPSETKGWKKLEDMQDVGNRIFVLKIAYEKKFPHLSSEILDAAISAQKKVKAIDSETALEEGERQKRLEQIFHEYYKYLKELTGKEVEDQDWTDTARQEIIDLCKKRNDLQDKYLKQIEELPDDLAGEALQNRLNDIHAACYHEVNDLGIESDTPVVSEKIPASESEPKESKTEALLDDSRQAYFKALRKRGNLIATGKSKDFEILKETYVEQRTADLNRKLEEFKAELDPEATPEEINEQLLTRYIELSQAEEAKIDELSSSLEQSAGNKLKSFWRKHAKARLVLGVGLFGAGMLLTFTGVGAAAGMSAAGAGLAMTRGVTSGAGAAMAIENLLDTRTESLGKKGLIDELKNIGFKRGKKAEITAEDKERAIATLQEKYSVDDLGRELARLRIMALDKGVGIKEAARFGGEQQLMVEAIEEVYYAKLRQHYEGLIDMQTHAKAKEEIISDFIKEEETMANNLVSEQENSRAKAMARAVISTGLGLVAGITIGSKAFSATETPEPTEPMGPPRPVEPMSPDKLPGEVPPEVSPESSGVVPEIAPEIITEITVAKGDNLWSIISHQLQEKLGDEAWSNLNEAQQTHLIDQFKDAVVANQENFGITADMDIDNLRIGTEINFGTIFNAEGIEGALSKAGALSEQAMENIVANNEAIAAAAKEGIKITTDNVDNVAAFMREQGESAADFLSKDGVVYELSYNGDPVVATTVDGETVYHLVDKPETIVTDLDKVINHEGKSLISPAETATPGAVDQAASSVEGFISGQIEYSAELLEAAKAEGKLDEFVAAIFDSNDSYQQIDFLNDHLEDCTPDNHKAEIFLQDLKIDNVSLSDIDTTEQLDKAMQIFDTEATKTTLPKLGEGLQPRLIKYPNGKLFYTMVNANSQDINLAL